MKITKPKLVKKDGWYWPPSASAREIETICCYARECFPDIEDWQIAVNFEVFRDRYRSRGTLDGHYTGLWLDKYTGLIYPVVKAPYSKKER